MGIFHSKGPLFSFVLGLIVRIIPEVLSYPYPLGFDTVYYAARIKSGIIWHHWTSVFSTWLINAFLISAYNITQTNPFLLLKLVAPVLYALNVYGVYYFARKALNWNVRLGLISAFFFTFQLASLRISWDLLRNALGLAILLFTLPLILKIEGRREIISFALLSLVIVLAHEYASVTLFAVTFGFMISYLQQNARKKLLRVMVAISPAFIVFLIRICLVLLSVSPNLETIETNVIRVNDTPNPNPKEHFFVNYFEISDMVQYYPTYLNLVLHVFSIFILLYLPYLPLVFTGFFQHKILNYWTALLLFGAFNCIVTPFFALDLWNRWMFMLVYPFTFYAVNGVCKILKWQEIGKYSYRVRLRMSKRKMFGMISLTVILGSIYLATPLLLNFGVGVFAVPIVNLYFSSAPTVPLQDVTDTVKAVKWLNEHMDSGSSVLLHGAFIEWANLYLNKEQKVIHFVRDIKKALNVAITHGFNSIYFIWWNRSIGWYGLSVPEDFISVFSSGRISVFEYCTLE